MNIEGTRNGCVLIKKCAKCCKSKLIVIEIVAVCMQMQQFDLHGIYAKSYSAIKCKMNKRETI